MSRITKVTSRENNLHSDDASVKQSDHQINCKMKSNVLSKGVGQEIHGQIITEGGIQSITYLLKVQSEFNV